MRVRDADVRREYARSHPLLLALVVCAFVAGTWVLIAPSIVEASSVGVFLEPVLRWTWSVFYFVGSAAIIVAFWITGSHPHMSSRVEALALVMLSTCYAVYAISIVGYRGAEAGALAASVFTGLSVGCAARAWTIATDRHQPWRRRSS